MKRFLLAIPFLFLAGCNPDPVVEVKIAVDKWTCTQTEVRTFTRFVAETKFTGRNEKYEQRICTQWTRMEGM